jgi:hypothetical protein
LDINVVKLNKDMVSYNGPVHILEGINDFFKAVWVYKYNVTYYLSYSTWGEKGITGPQIVYATADNLLEPYRRSICVDRLFNNEDGTIRKVVPSRSGVEPVEKSH